MVTQLFFGEMYIYKKNLDMYFESGKVSFISDIITWEVKDYVKNKVRKIT